MYGESILNLLGEEEIEAVESIGTSQNDDLEMVDIIPPDNSSCFEVQSKY